MTTEAARRREALTDEATALVLRLVESVDTEVVLGAVGEAAQTSAALQAMIEHLRHHPDALQLGSADAPNAIIKLAHDLHRRGVAGIRLPGCAVCGRVVRDVRRIDGKGGACQGCYLDSRRRACTRCGRIARIVSSKEGQSICSACYQSDPGQHEVCFGCGRARRVAYRDEQGRPHCTHCYPRPQRPCSICGQITTTTAFIDAGPVCPRCYWTARPKRECGRCGQVRAISRRATDQTPDLCYSCDRGPEDTCSRCGRRAPRAGYRDGKAICQRCYVPPKHRCDFCGELGPITAYWASGAVCWSCYPRVRRAHHRCPDCGQPRTLTEIDAGGRRICADCAGSGPAYRCDRCGGPSDGYVRDRCAPCALRERLGELLSDSDGNIRAELRGVHDSLAQWRNPRSVLTWLDRSAGADLLAELARKRGRITHGDLDAHPRGRFSNHIRQALVHADALPRRDEPVERVETWLNDFLSNRATAHGQVLRPFATWVVLRRARQRATHKPTTEATASWARQRIRVADDLLSHLDDLGLELQQLDQRRLDEWLAAGNSTRYTVRDFVKWAARQRLTGRLNVPLRQPINPEEALAEDDRWQQLRRCLRDQELPLRLRVAGAFVLFHGHPVSRIVAMRASQIEEHDASVYLKIGQHRALLPPALATLVLQLRDTPPPASILRARRDTTDWLFPGLVPGQHLADNYLVKLLNARGIRTRTARNSALISLAADLPAPILADLLGLHINTAVRWVRRSKRDWANYVEARAEAASPDLSVST